MRELYVSHKWCVCACVRMSECKYVLMTNVPVFQHVIKLKTKCGRNITMLLNKFVIIRTHSYRVLSINVSHFCVVQYTE
jgi:hypothetical protein